MNFYIKHLMLSVGVYYWNFIKEGYYNQDHYNNFLNWYNVYLLNPDRDRTKVTIKQLSHLKGLKSEDRLNL